MTVLKTLAAASLAFAAAATPLTAAHASEGRSATVSYAGLDLSSKKGQAIFNRRIENAIEEVCGTVGNSPTLDAAIRACHAEAKAAAMESRDLAIANYGTARFAQASRQMTVSNR